MYVLPKQALDTKVYMVKLVSSNFDDLYSLHIPMQQKDLPWQKKKKTDAGIKNIYGRKDSTMLKAAEFYSHSLFIQLSSG